jgi:hypothetical protein
MGIVVTFVGWLPPPRYDGNPWTEARIEEAPDPILGPWTLIDTLALSPVDPDPTDPLLRSLTSSNGTLEDQWYRIIFADAAGGVTEPTTPVQNTGVNTAPFGTTVELFRILKITSPTSAQVIAAQRYLITAAAEIRAEIDLADDAFLEPSALDLCATVNLDRAADLWRHTESAPGILGVVDEAVPSTFGRYSWERYAQRLAPIKSQWGIA